MAGNDILARLRLADEFTATFGRYQAELNKAGGASKSFGQSASSAFAGIGSALKGIGAGIVVFNQGLDLAGRFAGAVASVAKPFVTVNSELENAKVRLTALSGSTEVAAKELDFLRGVAAKVPATMQEVINAGVTLKAFGADVQTWTPAVADLAVVMGTDMKEAADAMGRAFAGGAGAADILRERGILELVKSFAKVDDLTKLTLPDFRKALLGAMVDPAGKIAGAAAMAAQTWDGKMSMMSDAADRFKLTMTQRLWPAAQNALQSILDKVSEVEANGKIAEWAKAAEDAVIALWNGIASSAGTVVLVVGGVGDTFFAFAKIIKALAIDYKALEVGVLAMNAAIRQDPFDTARYETAKKELAGMAAEMVKLTETQESWNEKAKKTAAGVQEFADKLKIATGPEVNQALADTATTAGRIGPALVSAGAAASNTAAKVTDLGTAMGKVGEVQGPQLAEATVEAAKTISGAFEGVLSPLDAVKAKQAELQLAVSQGATAIVERYGNTPGGIGAAINAVPEAMKAWQTANSATEADTKEMTDLMYQELSRLYEQVKTPLIIDVQSNNEQLLTNIAEATKGGTIGMQVNVAAQDVTNAVAQMTKPAGDVFTSALNQMAQSGDPVISAFGRMATISDQVAVALQRIANTRTASHHAGYWPEGALGGEHMAKLRNDEVVTPPEKFLEHGRRMIAAASGGRFRSERSSGRAGAGAAGVTINVRGFVSRDVVRDLHARMTDAIRRNEISFAGA